MKAFSEYLMFCWVLFSFLCSSSAYAQGNEENFAYRLGTGDQLEIRVFNQDDLTGKYTINGAGNISMPLIGTVEAKNLTIKELEEKLVNKLRPDFLLNPRISIQVLNYRPFYILGEVENPDSYPYVTGMTYLNAVAIAGGFTYRAKTGYVLVIQANDPDQEEIEVELDKPVIPGDIIKVDERMF